MRAFGASVRSEIGTKRARRRGTGALQFKNEASIIVSDLEGCGPSEPRKPLKNQRVRKYATKWLLF